MIPRSVRIVLALAAGVVGGWVAYHRDAPAKGGALLWPDAKELHVPHAQGNIVLDGDADDPGWRGPVARTHGFVGADGTTAVHPHTEARFVWGDGFLYLNLYAADEDIRAAIAPSDVPLPESTPPGDDAFHVVFTDRNVVRVFDMSPLGVVYDGIQSVGSTSPPDWSWNSHSHVSHELDGTANHPGDHDEEWVIEMAIPFESLGLKGEKGERLGLSMHRCDTPLDGQRACGTWGEVGPHAVLVLD